MTDAIPVGHVSCVAPEIRPPRGGERFRFNTGHPCLVRLLPDATRLRLDACEVDEAAHSQPLRAHPGGSAMGGHINRLKMLKRQVFGRAHLDLLSRRFLLAPRPESRQKQQAPARVEPLALPVAA